jgi:HEAT repeat protein
MNSTPTLLVFLIAGMAPAPKDAVPDRNAQVAHQLLDIIRNKDGRMSLPARIQAARSLGDLGFDARAIVPDLITLLEDPYRRYPEPLEEALVRAIGKMGPPARVAIPALVKTAGIDRDLDRTIAEVVREILRAPDGPGELPALVRLLRSPDASERLIAAKKIGTLGPPAQAATVALTEALTDTDVDVRRMACQALLLVLPGARPPEAVISVLVKDLQDGDESVRVRAAKMLGRFGPAAVSAVSALQLLSRSDPDLDVRRVAAESLFRIQGR